VAVARRENTGAAPFEILSMTRVFGDPTTTTVDRRHSRWQSHAVIDARLVKALANDRRLEIMNWLKDPTAHFRRQAEGDLVKDGVCGLFIAEKLGVSQPTASEHLRILTAAGLIRGKRIKQWTFYKRDEKRIAEVKRAFGKAW
jgi:DNA-binding transcriptional ArsR family regulator